MTPRSFTKRQTSPLLIPCRLAKFKSERCLYRPSSGSDCFLLNTFGLICNKRVSLPAFGPAFLRLLVHHPGHGHDAVLIVNKFVELLLNLIRIQPQGLVKFRGYLLTGSESHTTVSQ